MEFNQEYSVDEINIEWISFNIDNIRKKPHRSDFFN